MSRPDAVAAAALVAAVVRPPFLCWIDIVGDPLRATTWSRSIVPSGTGDPELDGFTFDALDPQLVNIGPVKQAEGGSDTVTATLSGIVGPDTDLLNLIGDQSKWRGRTVRLWQGVFDEVDTPIGTFWPYHTGRMMAASFRGDPAQQIIEIRVEGYLAALSAASNRTYLDQADYDPGDLSAQASIAIANGAKKNGGAVTFGGGGGGGGGSRGGGFGELARMVAQ